MALCSFILVYIFSGLGAKLGVRIRVAALKVIRIRVKVLLSLVKALLASLSLPIRAKL